MSNPNLYGYAFDWNNEHGSGTDQVCLECLKDDETSKLYEGCPVVLVYNGPDAGCALCGDEWTAPAEEPQAYGW